ncbi:MAG: T9SS type A sorting domain-containing protein [Bacteroidetes bacterium]|nr:T9SS type A sorting domain-containing protein [Bacteroidota bacterium]MBL6944884.1 T9SS type A sorting domain-containing protein [Bacteroidales bacterium]
MKNFFILLAAMVFVFQLNGQISYTCQMQESQDGNRLFNGNCGTGTSVEWEAYSDMNTYIPDLDPNLPMHNKTILTINININVVQKDDETGNFPDNQTTIDRLTNIISNINTFYANYSPSDPISWVTELPDKDSRIRFSLGETGNERIYFYQNSAAWDDEHPLENIEPYIELYHPERLEQLNVYIFGNPDNNNWMHASMPSWSNFNKTSWAVIFYWDNPVSDWATSTMLGHEFGHNLDLLHTYLGGGASAICNQLDDDFLEDVFIVELPTTSNCPHTGGWNSDPYLYDDDDITNNLMGGTPSAVYVSPMQAGQMHRSLAITSIRKYVTSEKSEVPLVITTDQLWNFDIKLYRDIIIENGAELTISCHLVMHPYAKIIVKPGGRLIIDGGLIGTDIYEDEQWQGIQVWGDKTTHQYPDINGEYQQGYLELSNGAVIENAIVAVDLWEPDNYASTGGIVSAKNSTFKNNAKSVHALHYTNHHPVSGDETDYNSSFSNCTFEITEDYLGDETFYKHVDLAYVKGLRFSSCDFSLDENATNVSDYNHAIASYDAGFRVYANCTSQQSPCPEEDYIRSNFTGFWSAISAVNDNWSAVTFSVNRADFTNNAFGVRTTKMDNASVLFSDFQVGSFEDCGYGIFTDAVTGFAFEENQFTKYPQGPTANYFGISINSSNAVNDVYKNDFNGLSYANHSDGQNWYDIYREFGLEYLCNTNTNNYADFFVADHASNSPSGIQLNQGSEELMAGNSFSLSGTTWHFYNGGEHTIDYYTDAANTPLTPEIRHRVDLQVSEVENTCPSHYGGGSGLLLSLSPQQKIDTEQEYYDNLTAYNNTKVLYDNYVDGGSTEAEILDIQTAQPSDMWALRAQLLGDSPHLSFDVLKEASDKTDVFTESALFDILAANPDELKKDTLISYLENKEDPLPDYMIALLQQLASGITYKTALQKQMAGYKHTYTRAAHDVIRSILNDTVMDYTEFRNWLDNIGGITSDRQIISSYLAQGNFTDALTLANLLPNLYCLTGNDSIEHLYYMEMLNLYQTLDQQGRNTFQLDSTEKASITTIANNSNGLASKQAKSILEAVYNEYCHTCSNVDGSSGYKADNIVNPNLLGESFGLDVNVKPNPSKEWAAFEYSLIKEETNGEIIITNATGSVVDRLQLTSNKGQVLWDTRKLPSGIYVYTIKSSGFSKSGKLIISK